MFRLPTHLQRPSSPPAVALAGHGQTFRLLCLPDSADNRNNHHKKAVFIVAISIATAHMSELQAHEHEPRRGMKNDPDTSKMRSM